MDSNKNIISKYQYFLQLYIVLLSACISSILGYVQDYLILSVLPIAVLMTLICFLNLKLGFYLTAFAIPFSINSHIKLLNVTINTPLEPLLLILCFSTIYHISVHGLPKSYFTHPLSIILSVFAFFIFVSSIFSTHPLISLRICLQTFAFIIPGYWGVLLLSKNDQKFPSKLFISPILSFSLICIINFFRHATYNFDHAFSFSIISGFYSDHTIYATMASFMVSITLIYIMWFYKKNTLASICFLFLFLACISGLILSFSRAAMLSVILAILFYWLVRLKIQWWIYLIVIGTLFTFALFNQNELLLNLKRNNAESKARKTNLSNQVKSITNVNNDVSNLERINRWNSAIRMIKQKPYLGFGYGMYQYEYFPFQKESESTEISIRNPQGFYPSGKGGTAHSEYLLISSEIGLFGGIIYVLLLFVSIILSIKNIYRIPKTDFSHYFSIGLLMCIITYTIHGFFNNFLDSSKINFLFVAFIASIASIQLKKSSIKPNQ